ncbi:spore cortex-lytic enzyme [Clostridium sp. CAG:571]|jgi:N-acetylmuramoyl-L-alanine amidase|nr:spore cortex-lytic enzyme [Clostridium sp. CAG:571]
MRKKVDMQTKNRIKMSAVILFVFLIFISYNVFFRNDEVLALSKYGSRGDEVRQIQTKLKRWGYYSGNVDGIYGSKTLAAVKWFQSKNGLTADGIAGKKTLEAMGIYTSSSITSGGSNTGNTNDVNLLSRLIYGESRGEPYTGQVAVRCSCFK